MRTAKMLWRHAHSVDQARNLSEVWLGFRAAGAQCLVASGIVDHAEEVRRYADLLPGTA